MQFQNLFISPTWPPFQNISGCFPLSEIDENTSCVPLSSSLALKGIIGAQMEKQHGMLVSELNERSQLFHMGIRKTEVPHPGCQVRSTNRLSSCTEVILWCMVHPRPPAACNSMTTCSSPYLVMCQSILLPLLGTEKEKDREEVGDAPARHSPLFHTSCFAQIPSSFFNPGRATTEMEVNK